MDNKCPKCGEKLSVFYIKQNCPNCGCNLMYYNMENRLDKDAEKAEKEWTVVDSWVRKIAVKFKRKKSGIEDHYNEK